MPTKNFDDELFEMYYMNDDHTKIGPLDKCPHVSLDACPPVDKIGVIKVDKTPLEFNATLDNGTMDQICKILKEYELKAIGLYPEFIEQSGKVTVVHWCDKTVTTVICGEGEADNSYSAFAHALVKKLFGGTNAAHKIVDTHMVDYINAKKEEEKRKRDAEQKEQQERNHRRKIKALAKRLRNLSEAKELVGND